MPKIKPIDCTPPADLPRVVLVLDPDRGFWLRVRTAQGVKMPYCGYTSTLPMARQVAREHGYEPSAWVNAMGHVQRFYDLPAQGEGGERG